MARIGFLEEADESSGMRRSLEIAALCLLPFMALGLYGGHRLHVRLSTAQIGRIISVLLLTGASILVKATGSG